MKKHVIIALTVFLMTITLCGAVSANVDPNDVKYVSNTGNDDNNGNETNPYLTIGKGITSVNPNGTVNVADGTYYERLSISKNVNLVGQSQENTILDGNNTGRPLTINTGVNVNISLFTIQNGKATGPYAYGGGIVNSGNLTLNNCTVKNNKANPTGFYGSSYGGGIYNSGNMTIKGSTIEGNVGTGYYAYGGGINNDAIMLIEDSIIQNNLAVSSSDEAMGGGIYNEDMLTIINSSIISNTAQSNYPDDAYGGGIVNYQGTLIMDNSNLESNLAAGYDAYGGGIYSYYGTMHITNSNLNYNHASGWQTSSYGGGIYVNSGSLTLTNSNINQNAVTGQSGFSAVGGGIYTSGATVTITGGSISSNTVNGGNSGGGGISNGGIMTINGCNIQDNTVSGTSSANGGGIYNYYGNTLTVNDSTIKGNTANYGGGIYNYQRTLNITGSTIQENNATWGAGIWSSGTTSISDSLISSNIASTEGGGIYLWGSILTVVDSNIFNNTAIYGGGISNYGTLTVQGSAINDNTAQFGGGIHNIDREVILDNTELLRNTAAGLEVSGARGGAIFNHNGAVNINNSNIDNNTANAISTDSFGGGVYTYGGSLTATNSNINHNTATAISNVYGGGVYTCDSVVTMNFNRIVGNSPTAIFHSLDSYGTVNANYNWWGSNYPDFITLISGVVDYNPWLYMTLQANPNTIKQGEVSNLTVSFNNAFDGTTFTPLDPIDGHIPDKTPVTFNTDLGSVGSKTINKETINGTATATLTADEAAGIAHVNAVSDSQTVNTNVTIQSNTPTTAKASIKGGLYNVNKNVYLSMNKPGNIYYTRNGSTPTNASTKYTGYLTISSSTTLKFIAVGSDGTSSPVYTEKYVIDKTAPKVTVTTPTNKATRFSTTSTIVIKFSKNIKTSINWSKVYIKNLKTGKKVSIKKLISGNKLNLKMIFKRYYNTWYSVYIPAAAISDLTGNNMAKVYTFKFKTRR